MRSYPLRKVIEASSEPIASREQQVQEHFIYKTLVYEPYYRTNVRGNSELNVRGPFCPKDRANLEYKNNSSPLDGMICTVCEAGYPIDKDAQALREFAHRAYEAKERQKINIISLDLPPTLVKAENENEDYWIEARIGQRQGKLQGVVYIGRKVKDQSKKDYAQIIIDPEDEQMRFDKGNQHPLELLSKVEVTFQKSKVIQEEQETPDVATVEEVKEPAG